MAWCRRYMVWCRVGGCRWDGDMWKWRQSASNICLRSSVLAGPLRSPHASNHYWKGLSPDPRHVVSVAGVCSTGGSKSAFQLFQMTFLSCLMGTPQMTHIWSTDGILTIYWATDVSLSVSIPDAVWHFGSSYIQGFQPKKSWFFLDFLTTEKIWSNPLK